MDAVAAHVIRIQVLTSQDCQAEGEDVVNFAGTASDQAVRLDARPVFLDPGPIHVVICIASRESNDAEVLQMARSAESLGAHAALIYIRDEHYRTDPCALELIEHSRKRVSHYATRAEFRKTAFPQLQDLAIEQRVASMEPVPFERLKDFNLSPAMRTRANEAAQAARRSTPPILSTSLLLFAVDHDDPEDQWQLRYTRSLVSQAPNALRARDAYLEHIGINLGQVQEAPPPEGLAAPLAPTVIPILERAREIALRTTKLDLICQRHVMAALVQPGAAADPDGPLARLAEMGVDAAVYREALFDDLCSHGDNDAAWAELLLPARPATQILAGFSTDRAGGDDLLSIGPDVRALAALIAARTVEPPLSIGLFGDWGSGKTFFMRLLRKAIDAHAERASNAHRMQRDLPFYKHIVQIEFNAWHYVEGNLWASLVEHILANLYATDDRSVTQELQEELIRKLTEAKALTHASHVAVDTAKAEVKAAQEQLTTARDELTTKAQELGRLNAAQARRDFVLTGAHKPIVDALDALGLARVKTSALELEGALRQIHGILDRGQGLLTPLVHGQQRGRRFLWLLLSLLGAPAIAYLLATRAFSFDPADIRALAIGAAGMIGATATWLRQQAEWLSKRLDEAEQAQQAFDRELATQTAEHVRKVTEAEQKVREFTAVVEAAARKHAEAKGREAVAGAELEAATSGRLLANFIADRASSTDYRKHLGLLALVRDDFEKLSGIIEEENWRLSPPDDRPRPKRAWKDRYTSLEEEDASDRGRINRIVLYIDDLDRCPPAKVVEVLQAVHLLLAFPLFVVVVGVDARWITRSLETRYRELLLVGRESREGRADDTLLPGMATPNDYLEKIFQIPFWLKPMDATTSEQMVRGVLGPSAPRTPLAAQAGVGGLGGAPQSPQTPAASGGASDGASGDASTASDTLGASGLPDVNGDASQEREKQRDEPHHQADPDASAEVSLESLEIVTEELEYVAKLAEILGRSPRALKRFANVYRLVKVGLLPHEQRSFLAARQPLANYQAVLFLLAVDSSVPLVARTFFAAIERGGGSDSTLDLQWLVDELTKTIDDPDTWRRLRGWLISTSNRAVPLTTDLATLAAWTARVGRYSFEVGRS